MTNSEEQLKDKPPKSAFSVAASPFNGIKLELAIILIVGFVLWLVLDSITDNDLTHVAALLIYSCSAAAWLAWRVRSIVQQIEKSRP